LAALRAEFTFLSAAQQIRQAGTAALATGAVGAGGSVASTLLQPRGTVLGRGQSSQLGRRNVLSGIADPTLIG
jgi:hypothetical protein